MRKLPVDNTDVDIVRDYLKAGTGKFPSQQATLEAVAKGLGIHPNTVFARLKRLQEGGFLGPLIALPNPSVLGFSAGHFFATLPMSKRTDALLEQVLRLAPVLGIIESLDGWELHVLAADDKELDRYASTIRDALGSEPVVWTMRATEDWVGLPRHASQPLDLAILEALLDNVATPMDDLARTLGANPRTVQRRHERLREADAFRLYPYGDAMLTGLALRYVQFWLPSGKSDRAFAEAELRRLLANHLAFQVSTRGMWAIVYADEHGELTLRVEEASRIPGVRLVFDRHFRRIIPNPFFRAAAKELLRRVLAPKPAAAPVV